MNLDLSDHTALVCGASQGIGKACAIVLAKQGARVIAVAHLVAFLASSAASYINDTAIPVDGGRTQTI